MSNLAALNLSKNALTPFPANFGSTWVRLEILFLDNNQINALPADLGTNWPWWNAQVLAGNPIFDLAPQTIAPPNVPLIIQPAPVVVQSAPDTCQKIQNALISAAALHVLSTVALTAIASYVIGWKLAGAMGVVYLSNLYITREGLWV